MRTLLGTLALTALAAIGVVLLTGEGSQTLKRPVTSGAGTVPLRSMPAPRLAARQINRQDPLDRRRQHDEAWVFDRRPLLNALPTTLQGVMFEIGGLSADGRTTIIRAEAKGRGLRRARIAYETLRRRSGDRSGAYWLEIGP